MKHIVFLQIKIRIQENNKLLVQSRRERLIKTCNFVCSSQGDRWAESMLGNNVCCCLYIQCTGARVMDSKMLICNRIKIYNSFNFLKSLTCSKSNPKMKSLNFYEKF